MTTVDAPVPKAAEPHKHLPAFGFTRRGRPVHARVVDHLRTDTKYDRFNKRLALLLTQNVGTMTCFWIFCVIALSSLLAVLYAAKVIGTVGFLTADGFILVVTWVSQNFIQLVLLPALLVGQNLQNEAADARAAKTFEDVERIIDLLDSHTQGGLHDIMVVVEDLRSQLAAAGKPGPSAQPSG